MRRRAGGRQAARGASGHGQGGIVGLAAVRIGLPKAIVQAGDDLRQGIGIAESLRRIGHGMVGESGAKEMEDLVRNNVALLKAIGVEKGVAEVGLARSKGVAGAQRELRLRRRWRETSGCTHRSIRR